MFCGQMIQKLNISLLHYIGCTGSTGQENTINGMPVHHRANFQVVSGNFIAEHQGSMIWRRLYPLWQNPYLKFLDRTLCSDVCSANLGSYKLALSLFLFHFLLLHEHFSALLLLQSVSVSPRHINIHGSALNAQISWHTAPLHALSSPPLSSRHLVWFFPLDWIWCSLYRGLVKSE